MPTRPSKRKPYINSFLRPNESEANPQKKAVTIIPRRIWHDINIKGSRVADWLEFQTQNTKLQWVMGSTPICGMNNLSHSPIILVIHWHLEFLEIICIGELNPLLAQWSTQGSFNEAVSDDPRQPRVAQIYFWPFEEDSKAYGQNHQTLGPKVAHGRQKLLFVQAGVNLLEASKLYGFHGFVCYCSFQWSKEMHPYHNIHGTIPKGISYT